MKGDSIIRIISVVILISAAIYITSEYQNTSNQEGGFDYYDFANAIADSGLEQKAPEVQQKLLEERKIFSTTDVNAHWGRQLASALLLLNEQDSAAPIDLYLRTEGGWEADAFTVIDVMRSIEAPVNIHAVGDVHSAGLMLLICATGERVVYPYTVLGFHTMDNDEKPIYAHRYTQLFRDFAKLPPSWLKRTDDEFLYFDAQKALEYDVADRIAESAQNKED